jgi:molybdate transport system substrate-binding protein
MATNISARCADRTLSSRLAAGLALLFCAILAACGAPDPAPRVAAASDLRLALADVANAFEQETGERVELVFGSSGNFHQQLQQGAPFEMFLSADEDYVFRLANAGKTVDRGRLYALGRIALVVPKGSPLPLDATLAGLRAGLADGTVQRFAIANPDHAPYGARAREALEHEGLWEPLQGKLVLGENVAQAVQFAVEGGAQGGIVASALAKDPALVGRADHVLLPADWHQPLRQRMVLMDGAGPVARHFYAFVAGPTGRAILARHGFAAAENETG